MGRGGINDSAKREPKASGVLANVAAGRKSSVPTVPTLQMLLSVMDHSDSEVNNCITGLHNTTSHAAKFY